jgi:hypothetical protein
VIINENGVELKGKDIVADYFCNYFSHINTTVELNSPESPFYSYKDYLPPSENSSMFLAPVAFGEFQKVINNLKNGNSLGIDGFSTNILKEIFCNPCSVASHFKCIYIIRDLSRSLEICTSYSNS